MQNYDMESCNFTVIEDEASEVPRQFDPSWSECGAIIEVKSENFERYIKVGGHVRWNLKEHRTYLFSLFKELYLGIFIKWQYTILPSVLSLQLD